VNDGLVKELGTSARLLREDGGGGLEKEPVGLVKLPVGLVKDGKPVKLPVGFGKVPVNEGIVNEASSRLLKDPVPEG